MRSWFAALLALALGACATGGGKLDDPTVKKVPGQVAEGIFHCSGPSGPRQYAKCDNVPIVVLLKADGACLVVVPYAELYVHGGSGPASVTWNLQAPNDYKFVAGGVRLSKREGGPDPRTVYEDGKPVANGRAFQWKLKADRKAATFDHDVTVLDKSDQPCDKVDPLIHND